MALCDVFGDAPARKCDAAFGGGFGARAVRSQGAGAVFGNLKCTGTADVPWSEQIAGCTEAIGSGRYSGTDLAQVFRNRGNAYLGTDDFDGAISDLSRAITLDASDAARFNSRGIAYAARNDFDHALADLTQAIQLAPHDARGFSNRGFLYARHQNFDRAIADYDEAIRLKPDYVTATINRGNVYAVENDPDRAIADYTTAIAIFCRSLRALAERS
jgi:Flp pilus assembly protein TadD